MGTLNCPNQYKIPGGCAFDDLFDAWTLVTTIVGGVLLSDSKENMSYLILLATPVLTKGRKTRRGGIRDY